jgi:hypothetical protein
MHITRFGYFSATLSGLRFQACSGVPTIRPLRYLADNIRKAKCTRLGYGTSLSMLRTLDLSLAIVVPRGDHSVAQDPGQERNHDP